MARRKAGIGKTMLSLLLLPLLAAATSAREVHELTTTYDGGWIQDGVMFDVRTIQSPTDDDKDGTTQPDGITVHGLNILTPLTENFCVELYTKPGSFVSAASDADAWTYLGSFTLLGMGPSTPTSIPLGAFDPIDIGSGETRAFYVTTQDEKLRYTALDPTEYVTGDVYSTSGVHAATTAVERGGNKSGDEKEKKDKRVVDSDGYHHHHHHHGKGPGKQSHSHNRSLQDSEDYGIAVQILTGVAKNYPFAESWPHRVFNGALLYTVGLNSSLELSADDVDEAWATKRGSVTCDVEAVPIESFPSAAPSEEPRPTQSPSRGPTPSPTKAPSVSPTPNPTNAPSASPSASPTTLESTIEKIATTLHGGLKQSGMMFDIRVPAVADGGPEEGLTVIAFETSTFLTSEVCIEVYTKSGTYSGFENDITENEDGTWSSDSWIMLGAATVTGQGETEPTQIPIGALDPVFVEAGTTQAFYVTMTEPEMRYTEPKFGEVSGDLFSGSNEGHVELLVGSAVAYPFDEIWEDRIFNGAVVYALGDVPDGRYNTMTAGDRERSCPLVEEIVATGVPTRGPTQSPVAAIVDGGDADDGSLGTGTESTQANVEETTVVTTTAATDVVDTTTSGPTKTPTTGAPSFGMTSTVDDPDSAEYDARLAELCPASLVVTPDDLTTMNVIVPYSYTFIADSETDVSLVPMEMENALHRKLLDDKCPPAERRKLEYDGRRLQGVEYKGFRSNPTDVISSEGCSSDVVVEEGKACYLVEGGVLALVPSDANDEDVTADVGAFAGSVFTDPANFEEFGVESVAVVSDSETDGGTDTEGTDTDGTADGTTDGNGDLSVDGAKGGNQDSPPQDPEGSSSKALSTTGIIIVAVLAGTLALVILALVAMRYRKKQRTKRADDGELFREFPEEEERAYGITSSAYGVTATSRSGYNESFRPFASLARPPPPPEGPPPRPSSRASRGSRGSGGASPAVILNEADDISLFSSDKSRFAPSSILPAPDSPGSRGSKGSRGSSSSKKSVEFVRAGQSFSTTRSNQPEDTVDL